VRKQQETPPAPMIFDGEREARLIALACSPPPAGHASWSLRLLENKVVELHIVDKASDNTIGRILKNRLKPHLKEPWVIALEHNSTFIAALEEVLEVYQRPRDPQKPLVCLDEACKELLTDMRAPIRMKQGRSVRADYEYERNGTANLFMVFAPLEGQRHIKVTDRRTAVDYAQ
jgi:hypothetical protein